MWTIYHAEFELLTKLCGGLPADPELQRRFLEGRKPKHKPPDGMSITEIAQELAETIEDSEEPGLNVFQRVDGKLVVGMRTLRAHWKDMGGKLSRLYVGKLDTGKSFNVKVKDSIYYPPQVKWVTILHKDGKPFTEPTGTYDKPIHIITRQGPRSAIKTIEFVDEAFLQFQLYVLTTPTRIVEGKEVPGKPIINEADLETIFQYGSVHGYGPERGDGEGKYICTLTKEG